MCSHGEKRQRTTVHASEDRAKGKTCHLETASGLNPRTGWETSAKACYKPDSLFAVPVDHSRVILKDRDTDVIGSDYINANYIQVRRAGLPFLEEGRNDVGLFNAPVEFPYRTTCSALRNAIKPTLPAKVAWMRPPTISGR